MWRIFIGSEESRERVNESFYLSVYRQVLFILLNDIYVMKIWDLEWCEQWLEREIETDLQF